MTTKQTDREQIQQFGTRGVEIFNEVETLMAAVVDETATVAYRGENALQFKTKCTQNAVDFGNRCTTAMQSIATTISDATSFIAQNLGGSAISLEPPSVNIEMPSIESDTSVESADAGPLRTLSNNIQSTFGNMTDLFEENLSNLEALGSDGWIGPEYDEALSQVSTITSSILEDIDNTKTVMVTDITGQLEALGM